MKIMELMPKLDISTLCLTCLSVDRRMIGLKELCDVYHKVVAFDRIFLSNQMDIVSLCWECHATLQRIHKFQKQARRAQQLLNSNQNTVTTLSSLTTCERPSISIHKTLIKDEKLETDENKVTCEFVYENDEYDEIKTEVENSTSKHESNIEHTEVEKENVSEQNIFSKILQISLINNVTISKVTAKGPKCTGIKKFKEWESKNRKCKSTTKLKEKFNKLNQINVQTNSKGKTNVILGLDSFDAESNDLIQTETFSEASTNVTGRAKRKAKQRKEYRKMCEKMNEQPKYRYLNDIEALFIGDSSTENKVTEQDVMIEKDAKGNNLVMTNSLVFRCRICSSHIKSAERVNHVKQHKKPIECIKCELVFNGRREYFKHYKEWHKKFICDVCGVKFKVRFLMERHMRSQHTPVTCEVCNKKFRSRRTHREHMILQHSPTIGAYCVECDEYFDSDHHYRQHLSDSVRHKHKPAAKIPCPDCGKVFSKNIYMLNHRDFVHLKIFKNRCELCDKNYLRKSALINHKRLVHEGVQRTKDKICYICGRGFSCNKILSNHMYTHTGERPHACDVCPARFGQSFALMTHRRARHPAAPPRPAHRASSSRPFGCDRCPSKYSSEKNLEEHLKTIHLVSNVK